MPESFFVVESWLEIGPNRPVTQPKWATNGRQIIRGIADSSVVDCLREELGNLIFNKLWSAGLNLDIRYRIRATAMRWPEVTFWWP